MFIIECKLSQRKIMARITQNSASSENKESVSCAPTRRQRRNSQNRFKQNWRKARLKKLLAPANETGTANTNTVTLKKMGDYLILKF